MESKGGWYHDVYRMVQTTGHRPKVVDAALSGDLYKNFVAGFIFSLDFINLVTNGAQVKNNVFAIRKWVN